MTKQLLSLTRLIFLILVFLNNLTFATEEKGDTLIIHQADQNATPFNEIIAADTNTKGSRKHLVYELDPDGWYLLSETFNADKYDLNIVGGKRNAGQSRPVILLKDQFVGWYMMSSGKNITIEGIHWMQCVDTPGGNISAWARGGLEVTGTNIKVVLHDLIWDFNTGFAVLASKDGLNMKITNCLFRFNKPLDNGVWAGQGVDISSANLDTVLIQNCTWYGGGAFLINTWKSTENLFKMDHCTIADWVQFPIRGVHYNNAEFTNILFYNTDVLGEDSILISGQYPNPLPYGVLNADTIYIDSLWQVDYVKESTRNIIVKNNNNFVKQNIKDYWAMAMSDPVKYHGFTVADPTFFDGFMNSRTRAMFENDETWPGLVMENTTSLDPQFEDYFDYSDTLINYSKYYYKYAWPDAKATTFMVDPDDGDPFTPTDPMFYNLKITNPALRTSSTIDGPIGDLTWELPNGYNSVQSEITTSVFEQNHLTPSEFTLRQNYPNPFNPTTVIRYSIPQNTVRYKNLRYIQIIVYDVLGRKVKTLVRKTQQPGNYEIIFDASNLSSGIYYYQLKTGNFMKTKKMLLLK